MAIEEDVHVVTGAFGYSGKYIARRLLDAGRRVRTLTNSLGRPNPFGERIQALPLDFQNPSQLTESLRGAGVLYNTYWVRFNHADFTHETAVNNTLVLFEAAKQAGVRRVVHVSIANPSEDSELEYYRGKARLERGLIESGLSYAILRPTVLFGKEDILINNIAWSLRRFPVFPVFGDGQYRLRPIYVDDLATLAVESAESSDCCIVNAVGPESFTYRELVETIGKILGKRRWIVPVPPWLVYLAGVAIGTMVGDVLITREEVKGLMAGLLDVNSPSTGKTLLTRWTEENVNRLGVRYASELARRKNRTKAYEDL